MILRRPRTLLVAASLLALSVASGCSTTGSHELVCETTEVAPHSQPGSATPRQAFDWYMENIATDRDADAYDETSSDEGRQVYSDGRHQISVGALPSDEDQPAVWVVLVTYDCS